MISLSDAVSWSGTEVALSLFVVWMAEDKYEVTSPLATTQPRVVRRYELEDEQNVLRGRSISELDLIFDEVPKDLERLVEGWLTASIRAGGFVAWFAFEGSFDFEHLLTADVASQIYGVAGPDFIAVATEDNIRVSESWTRKMTAARRVLQ